VIRAHGGPAPEELEALGLAAADVVDFSASTNPYGPSPAMVAAVRAAALGMYPDRRATLARRRLGERLGVAPERLALGNGAADLLWALARALVAPASTVLVVEPTFGEWRAAVTAIGARVVEWRAHPGDGFAIDLAAVADRARACGAAVMYLCAPNVPTGAAVPAPAIAALAAGLPGVRLVVDQSFLLLSERAGELEVAMPDNVVCVRSLTKEHGIPGVRVGYLLAAPAVLDRIEEHRPSWSASAPALAAAVATCAPAELAFVADSRARLLADRRRMTAALERLAPVPSTANFFLLPVGDAAALRARLLARHRVLVRDCASFGLPAHIRVAARPEGARLIAALQAEGAC
jgi:histidinol-phosphate/aromatic aminotransferase/cobyric acid decarboxylase-like protein